MASDPGLTGMHAAIVAGGLGKRAATMTGDRLPKALLPVGGIPIIFRQIRLLAREGVKRVTVLAGHLGDQLHIALAPEATALGLTLAVIKESRPLGTAGCLTALTPTGRDTLIVYGDMLFDLALASLQEFHRRQRGIITIVAHPNDHPRTSDLIAERDGRVMAILPRDRPRGEDYRNVVPAGIFVAAPDFFRHLASETKADMIHDTLPALLAAGEPVAAYNTPEYMRDVGTPQRHVVAEHDLAAGRIELLNRSRPRPVIFFDCDGVLNNEPGLHGALQPDDVHLIPGAAAAVRRAREAGLLVVAVTNRAQVAKGFVTFEGLDHILGRLEALLAAEGGVLDRVYFCPHHPEVGFPGEVPELKVRCECRKPGTLLLHRAFADLPIDRNRSMLIGDSLRDIGAARNAGVWAYGVRTGNGCRDSESYRREIGTWPPVPDLMFESVAEAVDFGIGYRALAAPAIDALRPLLKESRRPLLISVCGRSRAGKSTLAHAIARTLSEDGTPTLLVRLDDWIVPAAERTRQATGELRNCVAELPSIVSALRAGTPLSAPGYDPASRSGAPSTTYDPAGQSVIVLEGSFAAHRSIREMINFTVFVDVPPALQWSRFAAFYWWKGLDPVAAETLWQERSHDEWPAVDAQRETADLIIYPLINAL